MLTVITGAEEYLERLTTGRIHGTTADTRMFLLYQKRACPRVSISKTMMTKTIACGFGGNMN